MRSSHHVAASSQNMSGACHIETCHFDPCSSLSRSEGSLQHEHCRHRRSCQIRALVGHAHSDGRIGASTEACSPPALRPSHGSCEFFCRGLYRKAGRSAMVVSIESERSRCVPRAQRDSDRTDCAANTGVCAQACPLRSTPCRTCSFGTSWPCAHAWIATVTCIHDACMHKCRE